MAEMTFDKDAERTMEGLKAVFGVSTYAQVVGKALTLAKIAAAAANEDRKVSMTDKNGQELIINLAAK